MKFNLVAIEETDCFSPEITDLTGKILTVYMYNPDEETFCCEVTPSYYLIPVDFIAEKLCELADDDEKEKLYDVLQESVWASEPIYVHCASINRVPEYEADGTRLKFYSKNDFADEEEAKEFYQANQML